MYSTGTSHAPLSLFLFAVKPLKLLNNPPPIPPGPVASLFYFDVGPLLCCRLASIESSRLLMASIFSKISLDTLANLVLRLSSSSSTTAVSSPGASSDICGVVFSLGVPGDQGGRGLRRCLRRRRRELWWWRWRQRQRWSRFWEARWSWRGGRFLRRNVVRRQMLARFQYRPEMGREVVRASRHLLQPRCHHPPHRSAIHTTHSTTSATYHDCGIKYGTVELPRDSQQLTILS